MTVASMPIVSEVARSRPWPSPTVPRQMLPPPTITASSRSNSSRTSTISPASRSTTPASIVSSEAGEARASPDILSTTRRRLPAGSTDPNLPASPVVMGSASTAHFDLGEAHDLGTAQQVADRTLLVLHVGLLQEAALPEPPVEPAFDDLGEGSFGFALVARHPLERGALGRDLGVGHVLTAKVLGTGESDVHRNIVGQLLAPAAQLHEHCVHPSPGLDVEVAPEQRVGGGVETDDAPDRDVLLERGAQVVDRRGALSCCLLTLGGDQTGELLHQIDERFGLGDEVGLAAQLDDGGLATLHRHCHRPLGCLALGPLGGT